MQDSLPASELPLDALPSLVPLRTTLSALLSSPFPPRSLHLRATSNTQLVAPLLDSIFQIPEHAAWSASYHPVQRALPRAVQVDCSLVASQKALFSRILNGLSGWGNGQWDDALQGVLSWDGRQRGYTVSSGKGKGRARDGEPEQDAPGIRWDYVAAKEQSTSTGAMAERKDDSLSGFLEGLRCIFSLGSEQDAASEGEEFKERPRYIVLHNADRLSALETLPVGQTEGTLLACFMRLRELTGKPIVPILVSAQEWLTLRPQRGATEPAVMLELPALTQKDTTPYLSTYLVASLQATTDLTEQDAARLLTALVDLVYQTFSPYLSSELDDYVYLVEKLWLSWVGLVHSGQVQLSETGRMLSLIRGELLAEIEALAELRPLAPAEVSQTATPQSVSPMKANGHAHTPTKQAPLPGFAAASPSFYSPSVTPSKRAHGSTSSVQTNIASLASSLPLLARYILISAFLASSNPSRKDLQMLATEEDDLFGGRKKRKGGATRKTPQRKKLDANGVAKKEAVPQRLLGPKPFPVERLVAITECILPVELRSLARSPDMLQQIVTLTNLRLLAKTSSAASGPQLGSGTGGSGAVSAFDKLDGVKLKCSNSLELDLVEALGKSVGFKVSERLWEAL